MYLMYILPDISKKYTSHLTVAELCHRSTNCTGGVVEGPLTARECCVGTEDGLSYEVDGVCTVIECKGNSPFKQWARCCFQ